VSGCFFWAEEGARALNRQAIDDWNRIELKRMMEFKKTGALLGARTIDGGKQSKLGFFLHQMRMQGHCRLLWLDLASQVGRRGSLMGCCIE